MRPTPREARPRGEAAASGDRAPPAAPRRCPVPGRGPGTARSRRGAWSCAARPRRGAPPGRDWRPRTAPTSRPPRRRAGAGRSARRVPHRWRRRPRGEPAGSAGRLARAPAGLRLPRRAPGCRARGRTSRARSRAPWRAEAQGAPPGAALSSWSPNLARMTEEPTADRRPALSERGISPPHRRAPRPLHGVPRRSGGRRRR